MDSRLQTLNSLEALENHRFEGESKGAKVAGYLHGGRCRPMVDDVGTLGEVVGLEEVHQLVKGLFFGFLVLVVVYQPIPQGGLQGASVRGSLHTLDNGDSYQFLHWSCTKINKYIPRG